MFGELFLEDIQSDTLCKGEYFTSCGGVSALSSLFRSLTQNLDSGLGCRWSSCCVPSANKRDAHQPFDCHLQVGSLIYDTDELVLTSAISDTYQRVNDKQFKVWSMMNYTLLREYRFGTVWDAIPAPFK